MTLTPEEHERLRYRINRLRYCDLATRVLCRRSGIVEGWIWSAKGRGPPLPFHERATLPGFCRVCGQPIYGGGSFRSFAGALSKRLTWHNVCTEAYFLWTKPGNYADALIFRQRGLCAVTSQPLRYPIPDDSCEVDHEVPIYRVRRDHFGEPWCDLLRFWGLSNLRAISRAAHVIKTSEEARERSNAPNPRHPGLAFPTGPNSPRRQA